ncbi:hypothetical protein GGF42_002066 [Coemansia sp. RSA 2424]|nr:hypothetical protein GGF42_002066 [Coemansia sp. RSA 2424]
MYLLLRSRIPASALRWPQQRLVALRLQPKYVPAQRMHSKRPPPPPPLAHWAKPALYTAGGVALVVFAWPVLRFVVIGGMAYGAYRLVRTWLLLRSLSQGPRLTRDDIGGDIGGGGPLAELWRAATAGLLRRSVFSGLSVSPQLVEQLRVASEARLRANVEVGDARLLEALGGDDGDSASLVQLGEAMQVESSTVQTGGAGQSRTCVEALFPVFVDGRATPLFVQAEGSAVPGVVESASVLARLASGEVAEIKLDVQPSSSSYEHGSGAKRGGGRRVQDAEYKDL